MPQERAIPGVVTVCIAVVVTASCGRGPGGVASISSPAPVRTISSVVTTTAASNTAAQSSESTLPTDTSEPASTQDFPSVLIGTWSGGEGKTLAFTADGRYRSNSALGEGQAVVSGDRMMLEPDGRNPLVTSWSVAGGRLYLGTTVYLRDDAGSGSISLVGAWYEVNGYALFRFTEKGTFEFSDSTRGENDQGAYSVDGARLTLRPNGQTPVTFTLHYDGTYLTFVSSNGDSTGKYLRVG